MLAIIISCENYCTKIFNVYKWGCVYS